MKEFFLPFLSLSLSLFLSLINYFPILSLSLFTFFTFLLWPTLSIHAEVINERSTYPLKSMSDITCIHDETHRKWSTHRDGRERVRERRRERKCMGSADMYLLLKLREYACERLRTCENVRVWTEIKHKLDVFGEKHSNSEVDGWTDRREREKKRERERESLVGLSIGHGLS